MSRATVAIAAWLLALSIGTIASAQPTPEPKAGAVTIPAPPVATSSQAPMTATGTGASGATVVRVEQVPPLTIQSTGVGTGWTAKEVIPAVAGGLGFVAAIVSIVVTLKINSRGMAQRDSEFQKSITQRRNELELTLLQEKLDKFYGPYLQLSETNALLAREFISRQPDRAFRTLPALLDPERRKQLSGDKNDWTIVSQIMRIDGELDRIIRRNAGLVDSKFQEYLARVSAHYRIIRLAFEDKLGGDPYGNFAKYYVYTWQLDKVLKLEIKRLQDRCRLLREQLTVVHPPLEPLSIPADLSLEPWPDPRKDWQAGAARAVGSPGHVERDPSDGAKPKPQVE
ncbi:MAG: hypothetical protein ACREF4_01535 [Gammaproteobacteria bacterium]